ncbi:MAG: helix-turn-helix domain-containing protein [Candidatus Geothermincolia bacterium]
MSDFGKWFRNARQSRGLSQEKLAGKAGLSHAYVSALERGVRTRPSVDKMKGIAKALNVGLDELMAAAGYVPPPDEIDRLGIPFLEALKRDRVLSHEAKALIEQIYKESLKGQKSK